ncbi:MAG: hypothetical protein QG673_2084 [Pseudomonadota bacterium]|nr:hypothetical protein [Pseudomonadota bacterium]
MFGQSKDKCDGNKLDIEPQSQQKINAFIGNALAHKDNNSMKQIDLDTIKKEFNSLKLEHKIIAAFILCIKLRSDHRPADLGVLNRFMKVKFSVDLLENIVDAKQVSQANSTFEEILKGITEYRDGVENMQYKQLGEVFRANGLKVGNSSHSSRDLPVILKELGILVDQLAHKTKDAPNNDELKSRIRNIFMGWLATYKSTNVDNYTAQKALIQAACLLYNKVKGDLPRNLDDLKKFMNDEYQLNIDGLIINDKMRSDDEGKYFNEIKLDIQNYNQDKKCNNSTLFNEFGLKTKPTSTALVVRSLASSPSTSTMKAESVGLLYQFRNLLNIHFVRKANAGVNVQNMKNIILAGLDLTVRRKMFMGFYNIIQHIAKNPSDTSRKLTIPDISKFFIEQQPAPVQQIEQQPAPVQQSLGQRIFNKFKSNSDDKLEIDNFAEFKETFVQILSDEGGTFLEEKEKWKLMVEFLSQSANSLSTYLSFFESCKVSLKDIYKEIGEDKIAEVNFIVTDTTVINDNIGDLLYNIFTKRLDEALRCSNLEYYSVADVIFDEFYHEINKLWRPVVYNYKKLSQDNQEIFLHQIVRLFERLLGDEKTLNYERGSLDSTRSRTVTILMCTLIVVLITLNRDLEDKIATDLKDAFDDFGKLYPACLTTDIQLTYIEWFRNPLCKNKKTMQNFLTYALRGVCRGYFPEESLNKIFSVKS